MKTKMYFIITFFIVLLFGCTPGETMDLLDEEIIEVKVSMSQWLGNMNQEAYLSIKDEEMIAVFSSAILSAREQKKDNTLSSPDFDVIVAYKEGYPSHAMHLWLGDENEESTFSYFMGDATYITPSVVTNQLREIISSQ
ncbi:hypothetical protein [Evansella cellulosilytica]|uniref:YhfM-like domain-containing protein n=1 Tax=Evansella cellulosilytica (strain ATCC 21833 / DSM 2522 / FERM P-1141 / JCM 9156 / N-4) TaxID=649639 RepID=E6TZ67_EVAC2|nr:hypothetical protein [Evansella cellulosilytica]ADU28929.1 hypothetical protein Bcell_0647 [Evansella cellulosilytica DSM 2522]